MTIARVEADEVIVRQEWVEGLECEIKRLRETLRTIGTDCENYTGAMTCVSAGRERNARYAADAWCHGCIARDALAPSKQAAREENS